MFSGRKVTEIIFMLTGTVPGAIGTYLLQGVSLRLLIRRAIVVMLMICIVIVVGQ